MFKKNKFNEERAKLRAENLSLRNQKYVDECISELREAKAYPVGGDE